MHFEVFPQMFEICGPLMEDKVMNFCDGVESQYL